ncbi:hypothetical protein B0F90DRAFT_1736663 [Multifurca ochricompacta]|uniref:Uncharacterized protein n=1 Tax=Multifurca ochricompacta TaxID=376703 RepID=A0AAD4QM46_9AGAM|nr:hypothetical protein B0F90DRAFT_1736663 [Multifurca ochricompacta]
MQQEVREGKERERDHHHHQGRLDTNMPYLGIPSHNQKTEWSTKVWWTQVSSYIHILLCRLVVDFGSVR